MSEETFTNRGTFDGLEAQVDLTLPNVADDDFNADIQLSQGGVAPTINVVFAVDRSGSTTRDTGINFDGEPGTENFLEAQVFAIQEQLNTLLDAGFDPADINVTIVDYANNVNSFTRTLEDIDELNAYAAGLMPGGSTRYDRALTEVENALNTNGASADDTNIVYFYSDGRPNPEDQDFQTPLESLEDAFEPTIFGVGFGTGTRPDDLAIIDSGDTARIVENEADLEELVDTPPPLPDVESFNIVVDNVVVETIPIDDPRVVVNPTGFTITDLDVSGYATTPDEAQTLDVRVDVNFSNGETLSANGPVKILDGIVEGTAGGDFIDGTYDQDPEGDMVDAQDNIDQSAVGLERDVDTIRGFGGDDTINAGVADDLISGGEGNDTFIEVAGDGADTITDFGADDTGPIDDDDQSNNDFVDLDGFYNETTRNLVNDNATNPDNNFGNAIGMLRADAEDGVIDGVINGEDLSAFIGDVNLTLQDGSGGSVTGMDLTFDNTNVACFVRGTQIATRDGLVPIEALKAGDEVITMDRGYQKVRWIGSTSVPAEGALAPVVIRKGTMGNERDLRVSPQHRMLVRGWHVELMFGQKEALVPAKALINDETVFPLEGGTVDYFHMMFDRHELIYAEGIPSESFHPGHVGLGSFAEETREEILTLFPKLREGAARYSEHVRPSLKFREGKVLAENPELMQADPPGS